MLAKRPWTVPSLFMMRQLSTEAANTPMSSTSRIADCPALNASSTPRTGLVRSCWLNRLSCPTSSKASSRLARLSATTSTTSSISSTGCCRFLAAALFLKKYLVNALVLRRALWKRISPSKLLVSTPIRIPVMVFFFCLTSGESAERVAQSEGIKDQNFGQFFFRLASRLSLYLFCSTVRST